MPGIWTFQLVSVSHFTPLSTRLGPSASSRFSILQMQCRCQPNARCRQSLPDLKCLQDQRQALALQHHVVPHQFVSLESVIGKDRL